VSELVNFLLMAFTFIGLIGFIVSLVYSLQNHYLTQFASSLWLIFGVAMCFACLWAFTASVTYWGIYAETFRAIENIFLACFASFLLAITYISYTGDVKLM
jgi:hypothetical protein